MTLSARRKAACKLALALPRPTAVTAHGPGGGREGEGGQKPTFAPSRLSLSLSCGVPMLLSFFYIEPQLCLYTVPQRAGPCCCRRATLKRRRRHNTQCPGCRGIGDKEKHTGSASWDKDSVQLELRNDKPEKKKERVDCKKDTRHGTAWRGTVRRGAALARISWWPARP